MIPTAFATFVVPIVVPPRGSLPHPEPQRLAVPIVVPPRGSLPPPEPQRAPRLQAGAFSKAVAAMRLPSSYPLPSPDAPTPKELRPSAPTPKHPSYPPPARLLSRVVSAPLHPPPTRWLRPPRAPAMWQQEPCSPSSHSCASTGPGGPPTELADMERWRRWRWR